MKTLIGTVLLAISIPATSWAESLQTPLNVLQRNWAEIQYRMTEQQQEDAFIQLLAKAQEAVQQHPNDANYLIWQGIIQSSTAGAKGGLGALSLAKEARQSFEQAMEVNANALNGSAYTSLGVLYHKVPAWPIGFGSDKKSEKLLKQALEINPDGIDSNYFYAEFLYDDKQYAAAKAYLLKAQQAAPRPDRPLADQGRQKEIRSLLTKVNARLS
ncbi:tetratricopeptide repeat protein [Marinomonas ostreistagni]|uniref:tetratricopeptide repeat protein n=1 Tax=Marinomonas ostreistagni TaxID=359209 RepID=UPI00194F8ED1|nr:hypothetical protein [Marinomonas ostreistagni]MBM6549515.1 hypothetical protein [Marinomonas ostreistagni]